MSDTDHLAGLIREALDEFESIPLSKSVRRSLRIAVLNGDSTEAWMAKTDLRTISGSKMLRANETQAVFPDLDSSQITTTERVMFEEWMKERKPSVITEPLLETYKDDGSGILLAGSVEQLELDLARLEFALENDGPDSKSRFLVESAIGVNREIQGRIRLRTFLYLCRCESSLALGWTSSSIFDRHRQRVDGYLKALSPELLEKFNAAYRRANDGDRESLTHALTSCRRILVAVADIVFPARATAWRDGAGADHVVDADRYLNRIHAFLAEANSSGTMKRVTSAAVDDLMTRIDSLSDSGGKGVHASVTQSEVDLCVVQTYLLAGELLAIFEVEGGLQVI